MRDDYGRLTTKSMKIRRIDQGTLWGKWYDDNESNTFFALKIWKGGN